jgi:ABC-2 type transport system ATP-binding protein
MTAPGFAMEARNLRRSFGTERAVDGVTFGVRAGELYGLVGPDGAGKTTTVRMLVGLITPDGGEVRLEAAGGAKAGSEAAREAVGYMPQQFSLYGDLSVGENLQFFGQLFGLTKTQRHERETRLLDVTRLGPFRDRRADALSGGMYKKLALACALLHHPKVLLLDEPTNGVDPVSRRELWDLLYEFVSEGMAVLLATPYMDEASRCHRVGLMHRGRLIAEDAPAALVKAFPHPAFLLHAADRDRLERELTDRPDVMALSPQGTALRVVVRVSEQAAFRVWFAAQSHDKELEVVEPDFEDVFLGLSSAPREVAE